RILTTQLASALRDLSGLDETLLTLSLIAAEVQQRKTCLQKYVSDLRGALSPVRVLPAETLGAIFGMCFDADQAAETYSITDVHTAPMVLTHVSSRWRSVCLSTGSLWHHVDI
ncbi:hypothetical protein B0H16DRAFT_1265733, partial [Mycena metata]